MVCLWSLLSKVAAVCLKENNAVMRNVSVWVRRKEKEYSRMLRYHSGNHTVVKVSRQLGVEKYLLQRTLSYTRILNSPL
jgi:hypothetical protein